MKKPNDIKRPNPKTPPLQRLFRQRARMIHKSADACMIRHPQTAVDGIVRPMIPWRTPKGEGDTRVIGAHRTLARKQRRQREELRNGF